METATEKCGGGDVGQQEQWKWSGSNSERGVIEKGRRGGEGVGKIKLSFPGE